MLLTQLVYIIIIFRRFVLCLSYLHFATSAATKVRRGYILLFVYVLLGLVDKYLKRVWTLFLPSPSSPVVIIIYLARRKQRAYIRHRQLEMIFLCEHIIRCAGTDYVDYVDCFEWFLSKLTRLSLKKKYTYHMLYIICYIAFIQNTTNLEYHLNYIGMSFVQISIALWNSVTLEHPVAGFNENSNS